MKYEYEVPQSRLYCLCINVALCSTALQCICRVIRRSSMTMKAHTYYIIFGRPPIGGKLPLYPPGGATDWHLTFTKSRSASTLPLVGRVAAVLCDWKGNRKYGISPAMRHGERKCADTIGTVLVPISNAEI